MSIFDYLRPRVPGWAYIEGNVCLCVCLYGMQFYLGSCVSSLSLCPATRLDRNSTAQAMHLNIYF